MSPQMKKILLLLSLILAAGLLIWLAIYFYFTGHLTISTNDKAAVISVTRITPFKTVLKPTIANNYSLRLTSGVYRVHIENKTSAFDQLVTIIARQSKSVSADLVPLTPIEIVANVPATSIIADAASIEYVNRNNTALYRIGADNLIQNISGPYSFRTIKWADKSYGIAIDNSGQLYSVTPTIISKFATPFDTLQSTTFAVAPNHDVYTSDGSRIYRSRPGLSSQLIYTSAKRISISAAGNLGVLAQESEDKNKRTQSELLSIAPDGTISRSPGDAYDVAWSPSGKYVMINSDERSVVMDMKLNEITRLPDNNVGAPIWMSDSTLLYNDTNKLWSFNIQTSTASLIASSGQDYFSEQFPSIDGNFVYVSITDGKTGDITKLGRVAMKRQPYSSLATQLGVILPNTVDNCALSLVNFTRPTVSVSGPAASGQTCLQSAHTYLSTYQIDPTAPGYDFIAY